MFVHQFADGQILAVAESGQILQLLKNQLRTVASCQTIIHACVAVDRYVESLGRVTGVLLLGCDGQLTLYDVGSEYTKLVQISKLFALISPDAFSGFDYFNAV